MPSYISAQDAQYISVYVFLVSLCVCTPTYVRMYACLVHLQYVPGMHTHMPVYIYVYVEYMPVYIYMYVDTHTHTHTHIHTHIISSDQLAGPAEASRHPLLGTLKAHTHTYTHT
jgi:hypothetical protein